MRAHAYGRFRFDDLDLISETGWRIRAPYEGHAVVDRHGQIVEVAVAATSPTGERRDMPVYPEDGDLHADLMRALIADYATQIADAANDAYEQSRVRPAYA